MSWLSSKKDKSKDSEALNAKKDFYLACKLNKGTREEKSIQIKIALRCRAVIDKTFIEGAEKQKIYKVKKLKAIWDQSKMPPQPKVSCYQEINSINGVVVGYIPEDYAKQVFKIAGDFQNEEISIDTAIRQTQYIADEISKKLMLEESFKTLNFLREELKISNSNENEK